MNFAQKNKIMSSMMIIAAATILTINCGKKKHILVDGSSTVYPVTEAVAEEFRSVNSSVQVTVGISGTGGGFKKFCNSETDISDASRKIKNSEVELCSKSGIEYQEMAIAFDGLAVLVNKENTLVNELTVEQLRKIFSADSKTVTWKEINPAWPAETIKIYSPGQDSGTYDYFVEEIIGKKGRVRDKATFSEDDNVLVTGISGDKNSIGFFGLAYYEENKDKLKLVSIVNPKTGKAVAPNLESVKTGAYAPLSREIYIYISKKAFAKPEVQEFVEFYNKNAGNLAKEVGYIPLTDEMYNNNNKEIQKNL